MNRGFGGYNTEWLLPVLENQILPSVVDVVLWIILIGANDAMLAPGPNHVLLPEILPNSGTSGSISNQSSKDHQCH